MSRAEELVEKLQEVKDRIAKAASGREVTLIAVSKTYPTDDIQALYNAGHRDFGENYVQEWRTKADTLPDDIRWHFIGALQSNKVKYLANRVSSVQTVDSESALKELKKRARETPILIQVNTGNDEAKGGVEPSQVPTFLERALAMDLDVRGLMTIPPFDVQRAAHFFEELRALHESVRSSLTQTQQERFAWLSMGMTADYPLAIQHGATHVRVGSAIFGERR